MGHGSYSTQRSVNRTQNLYHKSVQREEIFTRRSIEIKMDPKNTLRECVDSEDHPNTIPIILALDVTGSMGHIPDGFIREEMTKMMGSLYKEGLKDVQLLFVGIGDHLCDRAPLQVGQFEADDELLDKWLKDIYLEGGGGGNGGESYLLAWKYAADNTKLDSVTKRKQKGFVFTVGDDANHKRLSVADQKHIFGSDGDYVEETNHSLFKKASEKFNVFHIHLTETSMGYRGRVQDQWKEELGEDCIILPSYKDIAATIANTVKSFGGSMAQFVETEAPAVPDMVNPPAVAEEEIL